MMRAVHRRRGHPLLAALLSCGLALALATSWSLSWSSPSLAAAVDVDRAMALAMIDMIDVRAGRFMMGADDEDPQQGHPRHAVAVKAFRMGATEVTFAQFDRFTRARGSPMQDEGFGRDQRPVINVSLADVRAFIRWLNTGTGRHFRLPSEAEWEYVARAGTETNYSWGNAPVAEHANTAANSGPDRFEFTAPVRSFKPNAWGFHDLAGNVWEMTADCLHADYMGAPLDGSAWSEPGCATFIARGGYYGSISRGIRPTARAAYGSEFRSMSLGFRLAEDSAANSTATFRPELRGLDTR